MHAYSILTEYIVLRQLKKHVSLNIVAICIGQVSNEVLHAPHAQVIRTPMSV